jgi:carboxyl-terminal processing protease
MNHHNYLDNGQACLGPSEYLDAALDIIQREAVRSPSVDWPVIRAQAHQLAAEATTPADTYEAIDLALRALQDQHSFLMRPGQSYSATPGGFGLKYLHGVIARIYPDSPAARAGLRVGDRVLTVNGTPVGVGLNRELPRQGDVTLTIQASGSAEERTVHLTRASFNLNRPPQGRLLRPGLAWLDLPDHGGDGTLPDDQSYPDVVQYLIAELDAAKAEGWVVDLRLNEGGNFFPMLAGAGPLTGEGVLGAFVRDGTSWPWAYEAGAASVDSHVNSRVTGSPYPTFSPEVPVAVLISPLTSSSGEIMAISFKGRANTRFFGEATQGLTSANSPYSLTDGAEVWLATSYEADRTGQLYTAEVHPDVDVLTDWGDYLTDRDAVLLAALDWLDAQGKIGAVADFPLPGLS